MVPDEFARICCTASVERIGNRAMIGQNIRHIFVVRKAEQAKAINLAFATIDRLEGHRQTRQGADTFMETVVERVKPGEILSRQCIRLRGQIFGETFSAGLIPALAGAIQNLQLYGQSDKAGVLDFRSRKPSDDRCALWANFNEIKIVESAKGVTHRLPRHTILARDIGFGNLGARQDRQRKDVCVQSFKDHISGRFGRADA